MGHEPLPMWVLLGHDTINDTLFVICHFHHKPEQNEIDDIIGDYAPEDIVFRVAEIGAPANV